MSKRRMVRSPIFEIAPSFCLPPVDFCRGVSPSQAAKSRPARKPSGAGTRAVIAAALRELNTWLADARRSGVRAVETFAAGLEQDGAAIRAALTTPWSSGQAEGQITRLKLIKRQMYGRASFDLLRRRVLHAA